MAMKVWAVGVLFVTLFTNAAFSEEMAKANFDVYEYRNGSNADDDHQDSQKNMTERVEELRINAEGIEIFLAVLERVVAKGGDTIKIPEAIDPEEHNISINDAFERSDDFLSEQTTEANDLLLDVYQVMRSSEYHSDPASLKQTQDELMGILESFSEAKQYVADYRRVNSMGQMYDYYYADTALEYEEQADDGDDDDDDDDETNVPKFETTKVVDDEIYQDSDEDDENDDEDMHNANEENFVLNVENDFNEEYDEDASKNVTNDFEATGGSDYVKQDDVTEPSTVSSFAYSSENSVSEDSLFSQNQFQAKFTEDIVAIVGEDDFAVNDVTNLQRLLNREESKNTGSLVLEQFEGVVVEEEEEIKTADENDHYNESESIYGNDSIDPTDIVPDEDFSTNIGGLVLKQFEAAAVEEEEEEFKIFYENDLNDESMSIYGNDSIDLADVVPDEELYDTKVEWKDPMQESESDDDESGNMSLVRKVPVVSWILLVGLLGLLLAIMIAYVMCYYTTRHPRSVTIRARSLSDSDRESRICVVSICDSDTKPIHPPTSAKLPSYLEVISEKVAPVYITDLKIPL